MSALKKSQKNIPIEFWQIFQLKTIEIGEENRKFPHLKRIDILRLRIKFRVSGLAYETHYKRNDGQKWRRDTRYENNQSIFSFSPLSPSPSFKDCSSFKEAKFKEVIARRGMTRCLKSVTCPATFVLCYNIRFLLSFSRPIGLDHRYRASTQAALLRECARHFLAWTERT